MEELQFALLGVGIGAGYVLLGQGIVLVYRGSGILNFAQGAVAMITAYVYFGLRNSGIDAPLSVIFSLLVAAAMGLIMQVVILRHLGRASALVRLIATLGLLTLLQGIGEVIYGPYLSPVIGILPSSYVILAMDFRLGKIGWRSWPSGSSSQLCFGWCISEHDMGSRHLPSRRMSGQRWLSAGHRTQLGPVIG